MLISLPSSDVSAMSLPEGKLASSENKGNEIKDGALHYNIIIMHGLSMLIRRDIHLWLTSSRGLILRLPHNVE